MYPSRNVDHVFMQQGPNNKIFLTHWTPMYMPIKHGSYLHIHCISHIVNPLTFWITTAGGNSSLTMNNAHAPFPGIGLH